MKSVLYSEDIVRAERRRMSTKTNWRLRFRKAHLQKELNESDLEHLLKKLNHETRFGN